MGNALEKHLPGNTYKIFQSAFSMGIPRGEVTQFAIKLDGDSNFKPQHAFI